MTRFKSVAQGVRLAERNGDTLGIGRPALPRARPPSRRTARLVGVRRCRGRRTNRRLGTCPVHGSVAALVLRRRPVTSVGIPRENTRESREMTIRAKKALRSELTCDSL
jgi:hypothetical protein